MSSLNVKCGICGKRLESELSFSNLGTELQVAVCPKCISNKRMNGKIEIELKNIREYIDAMVCGSVSYGFSTNDILIIKDMYEDVIKLIQDSK
jgi:transcription elongation factor Elf1